MKQHFISRKIAAVGLTLSMVFSMGALAFASDTDPNMTNYQTPFTTVVTQAQLERSGGQGVDVTLQAGPADASWTFTGFSTENGAMQTYWGLVKDSTAGITISKMSPEKIRPYQYASCENVHIAADAAFGSASVEAITPAGGFVNFTILVTPTNPQPDSRASFEIYQDASFVPMASGSGAVSAGNYGSDRNFVTVADSLKTMKTAGLISDYKADYGFLTSLTVNGKVYQPDYPAGWKYRIYRLTSGKTYRPVGTSAVVGIDDINLKPGDIVQWRIGSYNDTHLFPQAITRDPVK